MRTKAGAFDKGNLARQAIGRSIEKGENADPEEKDEQIKNDKCSQIKPLFLAELNMYSQ